MSNNVLIKESVKKFLGSRTQFVMGSFPMFVEEGRQEYYLEVVEVGETAKEDKHATSIRIDPIRLLGEKENPYEQQESESQAERDTSQE